MSSAHAVLIVIFISLLCQTSKGDLLPMREDQDEWRPPENRSIEEWMHHHGMDENTYDRVAYLAKLYKVKVAAMIGVSVDISELDEYVDGAILNEGQLEALLEELSIISAFKSQNSKILVFSQQDKDMPRHIKRKISNFDRYRTRRWKMPVPYKFNGAHVPGDVYMIEEAIKQWEQSTCVRFERLNTSEVIKTSHIIFTAVMGGCSSYVGKQTKIIPQKVNLSPGQCTAKLGTPVHEIGHALGLHHEQNRKDRDNYVTIGTNIKSSHLTNFVIKSSTTTLNISYDYGSVFHYDSRAFSNNKKDTITTNEPWSQPSIGQRVTLSFFDVMMINQAYCNDVCSSSVTCANGGYPSPNSCSTCLCPEGLGGPTCDQAKPADGGCSPTSHANIQVMSGEEECIESREYVTGGPYKFGDECNYHLAAPDGCHIKARFAGDFSVYGARCSSSPLCYHWVEIKYKADLSQRGPRFCCGGKPDLGADGFIQSESRYMVISLDARYPIVKTIHKRYYWEATSRQRRGFKLCYKLANAECLPRSPSQSTLATTRPNELDTTTDAISTMTADVTSPLGPSSHIFYEDTSVNANSATPSMLTEYPTEAAITDQDNNFTASTTEVNTRLLTDAIGGDAGPTGSDSTTAAEENRETRPLVTHSATTYSVVRATEELGNHESRN